ncbi:MAG: glycosyltransferase family 87 protein, partial [Sphingomicrobium sp.]
LLGLLTLKPQLGLFFPLMLLAAREWRVIGAAALSSAAILGLSIALWGVEPWTAYLHEGLATQSRVLSDQEVLAGPFMPTVFMNLRSAGVSVDLARIVQAAASLIATGFIVSRFIRRPAADDWGANALFLAASVFGTPYLLSYDTLPLTAAMVFAMPMGTTGRMLLLGTYFLALLQMALGGLGIPGPALIPLLGMIYFWKQPTSSTWVDQRN